MRTVLISVVLLVAVAFASTTAGASSARATRAEGCLQVVAAENFWGSIAAQLGGDRVHVTSIITNPDDRPARLRADRRRRARRWPARRLVIVNGIGYDPWASKLLAANPVRRARRARRSATWSGSSRAATRTAGTPRPTSRR